MKNNTRLRAYTLYLVERILDQTHGCQAKIIHSNYTYSCSHWLKTAPPYQPQPIWFGKYIDYFIYQHCKYPKSPQMHIQCSKGGIKKKENRKKKSLLASSVCNWMRSKLHDSTKLYVVKNFQIKSVKHLSTNKKMCQVSCHYFFLFFVLGNKYSSDLQKK